MRSVDLIIGPFFGKLFEVAAGYAKRYEIPIVNPFTKRQDFLNDNEFVYKLVPSMEARPAMIAFLAQQSDAFPIIIYGDSVSSHKEMNAYVTYFNKNRIEYEITSSASAVSANSLFSLVISRMPPTGVVMTGVPVQKDSNNTHGWFS